MRLSAIHDIEFREIIKSQYDLVIFASGYESRCQFVSSKLEAEYVHQQIVLGFEHQGDPDLRARSDKHFKEKWDATPFILSSSNEQSIYDLLNTNVNYLSERPIRILIDYSSMSRAWYAAILNWIRFRNFNKDVYVDLVYAPGAYSNVFSPIAVETILPLPGCEGSSGTITKSIAVFGLGFEGMAPLCVLDKLQPDEIFSYLAAPAVNDEYPKIAYQKNEELIKMSKALLELPLASVEITFSKLAEVITPYLKTADITFIPMGPKPHVLAAILLAIRFEQVTCLHVNGRTQTAVDICASGDIISTSVHFRPDARL